MSFGEAVKLEIRPRAQPTPPLAAFARNVTSQYGEDGIIDHIVRVIQPSARYCVEFGAWDGIHLSNCHTLVTSRPLIGGPWEGLMIEADSAKYKLLTATYIGLANVKSLNRLVSFDGPDALDNILREAGAPSSFGLLSVDIDGNDYHIWESLSHFKPEIVVIEFNPTVPNDVVFVQDKSFDVNHGCSLLALIELGKQKGYELAAATTTNGIFVTEEKYPLLGIEDNSIWTMYTPLQDGRIFQGMDSSIHIVGMDRLVWRGRQPVSSADFQVVPEHDRIWGDRQK